MANQPLECLRDYIGIRGCGRPDPLSGLWIQELGITLENIDKIASPEQQNFLGVWDDVQTRAIRRLQMAVTSYFSQKYKLNRIKEVVNLGLNIDTNITTPADAQWRGFIYKANLQNDEPRSPLQRADFQWLSIYVPTAGLTITVAAINLVSGAITVIKTFTSIVGNNDIEVNTQNFFTGTFIGFYASGFPSAQILLDQESSCDCACSIDCCDGVLMGATIDGASIAAADITTLETGNNTFGVRAIFSLRCEWDALVCTTKSYWANALWYCCAEELMYETIYTSRLNKFSTTGKEAAKERREEFKNRFHEELQMAVDCVTLDESDCCIECNEQIIKTVVCP